MLPKIEASALLSRIATAIKSHEGDNCFLRVSVADDSVWERSPAGDEVHVRWLCWSLESDRPSEPQFEVVSPDVTRERLQAELPQVFNDIRVVVDNEIEV